MHGATNVSPSHAILHAQNAGRTVLINAHTFPYLECQKVNDHGLLNVGEGVCGSSQV